MRSKQHILYLDMDGVLVNFDKGYYQLTGTSAEIAYKKDKTAASNAFLEAGPNFWLGLEWTPGGPEVWAEANNMFDNVYILSSMGTSDLNRGKAVEAGKKDWIKKFIPGFPLEKVLVVAGRHLKQGYARPNSILVDDMEETIQQWNAKGGIGIHHDDKRYRDTVYSLRDIANPSGHIRLSQLAKQVTV